MSEAGVRGIDLFKMAGESISGWIPRWKTARATSEKSPNFRPILFGLKVRTRGPQPSICVRTFSLFTIKVTEEELAALNLVRDAFHGEWDDTIRPQSSLS